MRRGILDLKQSVLERTPDWLVVQYSPFSYGRYGFNPWLASALSSIRAKASSKTQIALMIHEPYVSAQTLKSSILHAFQSQQLNRLQSLCDQVHISIEPWAIEFSKRWNRTVIHQPIGSNLSTSTLSRLDSRRRFGLSDDALLLGYFGTTHPTRLLDWVAQAATRICQTHPQAYLVVVGPAAKAIQRLAPLARVHDLGELPETKAADAIRAMDLTLTPFLDGVSTRRTSFFGSLAQGVPTVSTANFLTDASLIELSGRGYVLVRDLPSFISTVELLAQNSAKRAQMSAFLTDWFKAHYSKEILTNRLLKNLLSK